MLNSLHYDLILEHFKLNNNCPNCNEKLTNITNRYFLFDSWFSCAKCCLRLEINELNNYSIIKLVINDLIFSFECSDKKCFLDIEYANQNFNYKVIDNITFHSADDLLEYLFNLNNKTIQKYNKLIVLL